jgi:antitoxin YefM
MTIQQTLTQTREGFEKLLDQVTNNREVVVIRRGGDDDVAMIGASELESLLETAYLLRSSTEGERMLVALGSALRAECDSQTIQEMQSAVFAPS